MSDLFNFKDWLDNLDKLTDDQKAELLKRLSNQESEKNRNNKDQGLLRNKNGKAIACPHCGSIAVNKHGTKDGNQRYRCKDCKKTFSDTSTTCFKHTRIDEWQWKEIIRGIIENSSTGQMASATGLSRKTVWLNKNKVMQLVSQIFGDQDKFNNIVECDETEVHLSYKGKRDPRFFVYKLQRLPRHHRSMAEKIEYLQKFGLWDELQENPEFLENLLYSSRRTDNSMYGTKNDSVCIITGVDRGQNLYIKPACVGKLESSHAVTHFNERFERDAILVTDGSPSYNWFAEVNSIHHEVIPAGKHAVGPYSLSRVNSEHSNLNAYYPKHRGNLPATKHLELGTDFFWWLEKNKDRPLQEKVDELYKMLLDNGIAITYEELLHQKLTIDTKGIIPVEV